MVRRLELPYLLAARKEVFFVKRLLSLQTQVLPLNLLRETKGATDAFTPIHLDCASPQTTETPPVKGSFFLIPTPM